MKRIILQSIHPSVLFEDSIFDPVVAKNITHGRWPTSKDLKNRPADTRHGAWPTAKDLKNKDTAHGRWPTAEDLKNRPTDNRHGAWPTEKESQE